MHWWKWKWHISLEVFLQQKSTKAKWWTVPYDSTLSLGVKGVELQPITSLCKHADISPLVRYTGLWHLAAMFCMDDARRPNWCGYKQNVTTGEIHLSAIRWILSIIDLIPTYQSCTYLIVLFMAAQSKCLNVTTPCITFNHPLYVNAVEVAVSTRLRTLCLHCVSWAACILWINFWGAIARIRRGLVLKKHMARFMDLLTV
jgi:hypothetical protein